jgi:hypothetical protein
MTYKYGDRVAYDNGVMAGNGRILGVAMKFMQTGASHWIVEDLSSNIPNETYAYNTFVVAECHLKYAGWRPLVVDELKPGMLLRFDKTYRPHVVESIRRHTVKEWTEYKEGTRYAIKLAGRDEIVEYKAEDIIYRFKEMSGP